MEERGTALLGGRTGNIWRFLMRARALLLLAALSLLLSTTFVTSPAGAAEPAVTPPVDPFFMEGLDGWLYFRGTTPETGRELFRTDGVSFELVADIRPGPDNASPQYLEAMDGWIYFSALTTSGLELWRTDGDTTEMVEDIVPGSASSSPRNLEAMDGWLYFEANTPGAGTELWRSNGTDTTEMVADINPGADGSGPSDLEPMGGWLYFEAFSEATDYAMWRSNGVVTEVVSEMYVSDLEALGGWVFFRAATPDHGAELWRTNGVITEMVDDINPGPGDSGPFDLEAMDGWVYFRAADLVASYELWRSNGTTTELVADINPGTERSLPYDLEAMDGWVYFAADTADYGYELWRSNGTTTELVADVNPGSSPSDPEDMIAVNGWVYFRAAFPGVDDQLWRTDGTVTHRVGGEILMTGFVDASRQLGRKWTKTLHTPSISGDHTFMLAWEGDANLRMSVKEYATGTWIGENITTDHPKTLTLNLDAGVEYKIAVWATAGAADFTLSISPPIVSAGEEIFSATVDADRVVAKKWRKTLYTPVVSGVYSFTVDWESDANLRMSVKEYATGTWIGENITTDHPKTVTVSLNAGVEYKIAVWSVSGVADFTVVVYPPG